MNIIKRIAIISLFFNFLFTFLHADVIILNNNDIVHGDICECQNNEVYISNNKTLFIIPISMITKIEDDQNIEIKLESLQSQKFNKLNYNSFTDIRNIKVSKESKEFLPKYKSARYGDYYDHRVSKMIYGNTARIMDKGITSISAYDILLLNFCGALSNKIEADIYFFSFMKSSLFMANIKYSFYSSKICHLALKSGFRKSSSIGLSGENRTYYSGFPQSILFTFGNIDYYITGNMTIEPLWIEDNQGKKEFIPVTYHLGSSVRILKNMSILFEIFNSYPIPEKDGLKNLDSFSTVTGMRFFWSKNSFDLGLMDTFENSDRYLPLITYTHHF